MRRFAQRTMDADGLMMACANMWTNIAQLLKCSTEYVRKVIHDFNDIGVRARQMRLIARCCPRDLRLSFSVRSLSLNPPI
jgi:hypothetical protein